MMVQKYLISLRLLFSKKNGGNLEEEYIFYVFTQTHKIFNGKSFEKLEDLNKSREHK